MSRDEVLKVLKALGDPGNVAGMSRFGIRPAAVYGVPKPALRRLAKEIGRDHGLAGQLWATGWHEARVLASLIDDPARVTPAQMDRWANDFDNWDICDQCCLNLFWKTAVACGRAGEWAGRDGEYVKRAGFVLMACLAIHDRSLEDAVFEGFLDLVRREAGDGRNYVRKAVNWALRQIGKRNARLRRKATEVAQDLREEGAGSARWVGSDALRELASEAVRRRVGPGWCHSAPGRRPGSPVRG